MEIIKNEVFKLLDFKCDVEISYEKFDGVRVSYDGRKAVIGYNSKSDLARGFFLLAMNLSKVSKPFGICQKRHFKTLGIQLDVSRGGAPTIEALKNYIVNMASLGYNSLVLYMEDMFQMEKYPRFGYMRGRYSAQELKELDAYAYSFGVELIPAVEVLAHLGQYFQWQEAAPISNGAGALMVDTDETYEFIEEIAKTLRGIFRTNRVFSYMDEAVSMFGGKFQKLHGTDVDRMEVFLKHLKKTASIFEKYGFRPCVCGDMFFWLTSKNGQYMDLDIEFSNELKNSIPKDIDLLGWIYGIPHQFDMEGRGLSQEQCYKIFFDKYRELSETCVFLGGMQTWEGFFEDTQFTMYSSHPAMKNCLKTGVEEVFISTWGDQGQETNLIKQTKGMLPLYSEYCFRGLDCTPDDIAQVSTYLTKLPFENRVNLMERLNGRFYPESQNPMEILHFHDCQKLNKSLFYADVLYDLVDIKYDYNTLMKDYTEGEALCKKYIIEDASNKDYYEFCRLSFEVGIMKLEIFQNLRKKYRENDMDYIKRVAYEYIPRIIKCTEEFYNIFQKNWDETNKSFGSELHQIRLGGVIKRAEYVAKKLDKYIKCEINKLEELEQSVIISKNRMYNRNFHKVTTANQWSY